MARTDERRRDFGAGAIFMAVIEFLCDVVGSLAESCWGD
ncbi:hypothetical protein CcrColossus_gp045 [Caulobacter phage CcrColossus]|uniref:Uncharacterized protein n=1 Tax=Caulobacter phage CcrColossus TaxID=1211640 RepID=K4JUB5_9CAUD|nr:hypothetical protein CcrColossus_gp045 [Caulobacter phage CcrColossus]AFU87915.1 hypothetical protein CcrColossus_gp045 [Caulobacter phage CcrColossus]